MFRRLFAYCLGGRFAFSGLVAFGGLFAFGGLVTSGGLFVSGGSNALSLYLLPLYLFKTYDLFILKSNHHCCKNFNDK